MTDRTTVVIQTDGSTLLNSVTTVLATDSTIIRQASTRVISTGDMGPVGPQGPVGPAGPGGGSANYEHNQIAASATWIIPHTFGWKPNVQVFDTSGEEMFGYTRTDSLDMNTTTLAWELLISGRALTS